MEAAGGGHVEVTQVLLDHGAGLNSQSKDSRKRLASRQNEPHVGLSLDDNKDHKTDEMHTGNYSTDLHSVCDLTRRSVLALMEACMDGHVQVARLLLDHGADVNMPPDSYESPLTLSACGGHFELASLLIERGANLEEVNDEGYTPLMEGRSMADRGTR